MNLIADQQMEGGVEADTECQLRLVNKQILRYNATIE